MIARHCLVLTAGLLVTACSDRPREPEPEAPLPWGWELAADQQTSARAG